jgi:hypothetical protein
MAESYEFNIDASGAITELGKLENAAEKTGNSAASLKSQLRVMQQELSNLDPNSEAFDQLSRKTGEIKDKINDAAEATRANAGPAFESLGNNFGLLTQRLGNLDFEGVGQSLKGMAGSIKGLSFKEITAGIGGMVSGLGTLAKAILTNPILLLASVIIAIAMNFDKLLAIFPSLNEALTGVSEEMTNSLEVSKKLVEQDKERLTQLNEQDAVLKEQGFTERQILQLKEEAAKKTLEDLQTQIVQQRIIAMSQVETAKRNRDILKGLLEFITFPIQALLGSVDLLTEKLHSWGVISDEIYSTVGNLRDRFNTSIAEMVFDPEEVQAEATKTLTELDKQYQAVNAQRAGYHNSISAMDKAARDKRAADQAKADADELERRKKLQGEFEKIESKGVETKQLVEPLKTGIVISESQKQWQLKQEELRKEEKLNADYAALEKQKNDAKLQAVSGGLDALMALNDSFHASNKKDAKRQFQINKGLSIASATLKTYESATAAFATGTATGVPGLGFVYAAIAVAAGLANINKIRQSKFDEGGNSSTPTPTAPPSGGGAPPIAPSGGQQPQFSALNTSFLNNKPNQVTPQAYVLAGGVASSLEAEQKIRDRARL